MMPLKKCKMCCQMNRSYLTINDKILETDLELSIKYLYQDEIPMNKLSAFVMCNGCAIAIAQAEIVVKKIKTAIGRPLKKRTQTPKRENLTLNKSKRAKLDLSASILDTTDYQNNVSELISEKSFDTPKKNLDNSIEQTKKQNTNNSIKKTKKSITKEKENINGEMNNDSNLNDKLSDLGEEEQTHFANGSISNNNNLKIEDIDETMGLGISPTKKEPKTSTKSTKKNKIVKEEPNVEKSLFKKIREDPSIGNNYEGTDNVNSSPKKGIKKEKPFLCEICYKSFSKKSKLDTHMETTHIEKVSWDCPNCGLTFKSQSKFDKHVFSQRCKNSTFSCQQPNCNRIFRKFEDMSKHMESTHSSQLNSIVELIK